MTTKSHDYDVAFSFMAADESTATSIADSLEGRLSTFVYSRQQDKLAGTDGEVSFSKVFSDEAKLVVVLYRPGWGSTPWTRMEETAIRNRAFDNGYSFVLFVNLDDKSSMPIWLPKTQLWVGFTRYGPDGAATVIDARFQELGGTPNEERIEDRAARLERSAQYRANRAQYLTSGEGTRAASESAEEIMAAIEAQVPSLKESAPSLGIESRRSGDQLILKCAGPCLRIAWHRRYQNTLELSYLEVSMWRGHPPFPGIILFDDPVELARQRYDADMNSSGSACWVLSGARGGRHLTAQSTAEDVMKWWLASAIREQDVLR